MGMIRCAIVSFRLGLSDGVSVVAGHWQQILEAIGFEVVTVAGEGPVDRLVPGLSIGAHSGGGDDTGGSHRSGTADARGLAEAVSDALADVDLTVVENLCTIPLNLPAARAVAQVLKGQPAILHHHDPPWQRSRFAAVTELPPTDPRWRHVVINRLTAEQFRERGLDATVIYNGFNTNAAPANRSGLRATLGVDDQTLLIAHPVRAIPRKNIPAAVAIAEALGGTYWLLGEAEDGYQPTLDKVLAAARCEVIHRPVARTPDIYAAADLVVFPSEWEGFGNPPIEAAIWGKPCVVGDYPVAKELAAFGFRWFSATNLNEVRSFLDDITDVAADTTTTADTSAAHILEHNRAVAVTHFSLKRVRADLEALLSTAGWLP